MTVLEREATRTLPLLPVTGAWLVLAAASTVVGVSQRWPAHFLASGSAASVRSDWVGSGTGASPPLWIMVLMLAALVVTQLPLGAAAHRVALGVIALIGVISVVSTIVEAAATSSAACRSLALVGTVLSLAVLAVALPGLPAPRR